MNDIEPDGGPNAETATAAGTGAVSATGPEAVHDDAAAPPGRRVRLVPTPPGFWWVLLGAIVTLLGPFFGILIGSTVGSHDTAGRMDPLYWGFFLGGLVGVLGLLAGAFGVMRLMRRSRSSTRQEGP